MPLAGMYLVYLVEDVCIQAEPIPDHDESLQRCLSSRILRGYEGSGQKERTT